MRARTLVPAVVVTFGLLPVACGGGAPAPATPTPAGSASAVVVGAAPSLPPDLSEVPEPADLVGIARWKSPQASIDTVRGWTGLPMSTAQIVEDVLSDRKLAEVVLPTASVDAVVALDPQAGDRDLEPLAAVSVGLRSWDDARKLAQARGGVEVKPGVVRVGPAQHGKKRHRGQPTCVVAASAGDAPARIVCGDRDKDVEVLADYLTRTLPRQAAPASDLHAEVRFAPLERRYGPLLRQYAGPASTVAITQVQLGEPTFDRAVSDGVQGLVDETLALSADLDQLVLDTTLAPEGGDATLSVRMRGQSSWSAMALKDAAGRQGPPPAAFYRLPIDATSAGWARGADAKRTAGIRDVLTRLGSGFLAHEGVPEADRKVVGDLVDAFAEVNAQSVVATGVLDATARAAIVSPKGAPETPSALRQSLADLGWRIYGWEGNPDRFAAGLKQLAAIYQRPAVKKWLEKTAGAEAARHLPKVKWSASAKGLPAGASELDVTIDPEGLDAKLDPAKRKKAAALAPVHVYVILVPDGGRTWLATGPDRATLVAHLAAVKSGAPDAGTLTARAGLEPLKAPGTSGAFLTVASLAPSIRKALAYSGKEFDVGRLVAAIPRQGSTPIFLSSRAADAGGLSTTIELRVPKPAIEETVSLVLGAMAQAGARP